MTCSRAHEPGVDDYRAFHHQHTVAPLDYSILQGLGPSASQGRFWPEPLGLGIWPGTECATSLVSFPYVRDTAGRVVASSPTPWLHLPDVTLPAEGSTGRIHRAIDADGQTCSRRRPPTLRCPAQCYGTSAAPPWLRRQVRWKDAEPTSAVPSAPTAAAERERNRRRLDGGRRDSPPCSTAIA